MHSGAYLIDSHAHLTDARLRDEVDAVVARARAAGVEAIVTVASDATDSAAAVALAERLEHVYATVGIHPHAASTADDAAFEQVRALAQSPKVVALGETGLDYHYDNSPREQQRASFARHLELARELDLPVVVHCRDADADLIALLAEAGQGTRGVLHCFAGSRALLEAGLAAGWYVSFAGLVTFRNYDAADLLRAVPLERMLVETDSPYLAPVPYRGKRNEPAYVAATARRVAELRGEPLAEFAAATVRNTRALFGRMAAV